MANNHKYKLVITHPSQLSERWVNYYCLDELCNFFDVEFWDCSALAFPSFTVANSLQRDYLRVMTSLEQFKNELEKLPKDTILITEVHHNAKTYSFHKTQGHYFPITAHVGFYGNDIDQIWPIEKKGVKRHVRRFKELLYQSKLIKHTIKWLFHKNDANYEENRMREKAAECYQWVDEFSCIKSSEHRINHPDFETYLSIRDKERLIKGMYVVFIDDYFPYHPEIFKGRSREELVELAQAYYKSMNAFFVQVEKQMDCKVVIAAHPYANYKEHNPFEERSVYYGATAQLVKDSEAVCLHYSNAFSYIALFDKPVLLLNNAAMNLSCIDISTNICAEKFNLSIFNTDNNDNHIEFQRIDSGLRLKYIDDYLGNLANSLPNKELFIKYLTEFHDTYLIKQ